MAISPFKGPRRDYTAALRLAIDQRRLVVTKHGYLGKVHVKATQGDSIVVLAGFKMPVVLRRHGEI